MFLLKCQLVSDRGCVRPNNEDMVLFNGGLYRDETFEQMLDVDSLTRFTALVADGMGGAEGGEFASELAVQAFDSFITKLPDGLSLVELSDAIRSWVHETHTFIVNKGSELPQYKDMGTTLAGVFGYNSRAYLINIGDSRVYRYRNGILKQLSLDHSMRELTGDLNTPSNLIYNSLGGGDSAFADLTDLTEQILVGDLFLICSDGLSDMLTDEQIEELLLQDMNAAHLVDTAKAASGRDNVSVILLQVLESALDARS